MHRSRWKGNYYIVNGKEEEDDDVKNGELRLYIYIYVCMYVCMYVFHFFPFNKKSFFKGTLIKKVNALNY